MADPSQVQTRVGRELSSMPMGSMIASIAKGIAEGQWELDKSSMVVAELMSGQRLIRDLETGKLLDEYDQELPDGKAPRVIDSRVFFGFTYVRSEDIPEAAATAS